MAIAYSRGSTLGPKDLYIYIRDDKGVFIDPAIIYYEVFKYNKGALDDMSSLVVPPIKIEAGKFYAPIKVPNDAPLGTYYIRWSIKKTETSKAFAVENRFAIVNTPRVT